MSRIASQISENLSGLQQRIAAACGRAGRDVESVQMIAVVKYADWEWVEALVDLGVRQLGESRPQQLIERDDLLDPAQGVEWHLIGHLQRNKVRPTLPRTARIHSVDTFRLLERINRIAEELGLRPKVLLEVNLSGERSKDGFAAEELKSQWETLLRFPHVEITGLMTMAPHIDDEPVVRGVFQNLRTLRDRLKERTEGQLLLPELSMGMSGDFEIAIEEGATHIRLGSGVFAGLESSAPR